MSYRVVGCVGSSERCWLDLCIKVKRSLNPAKRFLNGNVRLVLRIWIDVQVDFHMTITEYFNYLSGSGNS